jgi:Zn-dependent protease with chaperone function
MGIPAYYFDGQTSRRLRVELAVEADAAVISGDVERRCPVSDMHVSERTRNAARKVTFPDGAYLEILDHAAFNTLLFETGHQESLVVRMQQSWRNTLIAGIAVIIVLVLGYLYGLPAASNVIARILPESVERTIGREALSFLDQRLLAPSELPAQQRNAIAARFNALVPPQAGAPDYEIIFRKSRIGPNALALPSGQIVLTDEIVKLVDDEDALMGVLAHELGHLHERHIMRRIIQSSAIGAIATVLFGDVSAVVANIPTLMMDLKYSRDAEREADDYAIAMLKANGISLSSLVRLFEKLEANSNNANNSDNSDNSDNSNSPAPYLSSHPPASERIARIRGA